MQDGGTRRGGPTRRQLIAAGGASALALSAGVAAAERPAAAGGIVFEDRSGTGRRRPGDPGIAGAMVSNGRDVVLTDAEGRWRLPLREGDSVFVIKPAHWSAPVGPGGLPRFSHLHQPTGPLPGSIDFALSRQPEAARFQALLLADTQPADGTELGYLRDDIIAGVPEVGAAFAINHGDVVFDDLSLYPRYLELLGATGIAWHHVPGNHDMDLEARDDRTSRETWKRVFGPRHYAFQHAGATFILLDNVHYFGHNPGSPRSGQYCGRIGESQLQFVRNVLAHVPREQLIVLSMHIPLVTYQDPADPADNTADRLALLEALAGRPHAVSFSGHMHLAEHHYLALEPGGRPHHHQVLAAASGGWWGGHCDRRGIPFADCPDGSPNGYHVLTVDGSHYATRFVPAAGKAAGRMRVTLQRPHSAGSGPAAAAPIRARELQACELVVNVFDGGPRTRVAYETTGPSPRQVAMRRAAATDPFVAELFARAGSMQKPWAQPVPSSHLWRAPVCPELGPGTHCLTVRASDEFGRALVAHLVVEVSA